MMPRYYTLSIPFFFAIALVFAPEVALAQQAPFSSGDQQRIQEVIRGQMAAFQRGDEEAAFSYASPSIRSQFRTPAHFIEMVKRGYRPVYRPRDVKFLELNEREGEVVQKVWIIGPDGVPVNAFYIMERQRDGVWKIGGCILVRPKQETI